MKSLLALAAAVLAAAVALPPAAEAAELGADRHAEAGVKCEACHGADKASPKTPDFATCTGCHKVDALVEKGRETHESARLAPLRDGIGLHELPRDARCVAGLLRAVPQLPVPGAVTVVLSADVLVRRGKLDS